jgi:ydeN-like
MKRAVLLHGTDGELGEHWFGWLSAWLEVRGYKIFEPQLPNCHTPDRREYHHFLTHQGWDFADNLLVGHSSGATTVLNLLQSNDIPVVETAILVSAFLNERLTIGTNQYEPGQFDNLWPEVGFDAEKIRRSARQILFIHSDNDPYCSYDDAREFADKVGAEFVAVHDGQHLGLESGLRELPQITDYLDSIALYENGRSRDSCNENN